MDAERNRVPLGQLRQVAEASLRELGGEQPVEVSSTDCLGPCKPGNVMGVGHPRHGVYLFNGIGDESDVRKLVGFLGEMIERDRVTVPGELASILEGRYQWQVLEQIPFR